MKKLLTTVKAVLAVAILGIIAWVVLYFAVPNVKIWTNESIFQIEQTVEDETPEDKTPSDETTGDETTGETEDEGTTDVPTQPSTGEDESDIPTA